MYLPLVYVQPMSEHIPLLNLTKKLYICIFCLYLQYKESLIMSVQMIIRVDSDLKNRANHLAKIEGKNLSQLVRELLEKYTKERDAKTYIDMLWNNIENNLTQSGAKQEDIEEAIKHVRKKHA